MPQMCAKRLQIRYVNSFVYMEYLFVTGEILHLSFLVTFSYLGKCPCQIKEGVIQYYRFNDQRAD